VQVSAGMGVGSVMSIGKENEKKMITYTGIKKRNGIKRRAIKISTLQH